MMKEQYTLDCILDNVKALTSNTYVRALTTSPAAVLNTTIAASGLHTSSEILTTTAAGATIQVNNKGTSTNVEVALYCALNDFPYATNPYIIMELDTTNRVDIQSFATMFDKFKIVISNKDANNMTTVDYIIKLYGTA